MVNSQNTTFTWIKYLWDSILIFNFWILHVYPRLIWLSPTMTECSWVSVSFCCWCCYFGKVMLLKCKPAVHLLFGSLGLRIERWGFIVWMWVMFHASLCRITLAIITKIYRPTLIFLKRFFHFSKMIFGMWLNVLQIIKFR